MDTSMPDRTADATSQRRSRRRTATVSLVVTAVVLAAFGGGWVAAGSFQSPAQRAAAAQAPPAGPVTVEVSRGILAQTVSTNAVVSRQTQQQVTINGGASPSVATKQPIASGSSLAAGTVVLEVNGRPVFGMPGSFPFYRDLRSGDTGPDVIQFQQGLKAAGYSVTPDGKFGKGTETATRALYKAAGYDVGLATQSGGDSSGTADTTGQTGTDGTAPQPGADSAGSAAAGAPAASIVIVPSSELIVFTSLPAFLVASPPVGTVLDAKSSVSVETGSEIASAAVASSVAVSLRAGMTAELTGPDNTTVSVTVSTVGSAPASTDSVKSTADSTSTDGGVISDASASGTDSTAATGDATVVFTSEGESLPESWLHATALAVITLDVAAKDSLLVPTVAVVTGGKGQAHVLKRLPDGSFTTIAVSEIGQMGGRSAVVAKNPRDLVVGDTVKVG
jgi:hypothetical protein